MKGGRGRNNIAGGKRFSKKQTLSRIKKKIILRTGKSRSTLGKEKYRLGKDFMIRFQEIC